VVCDRDAALHPNAAPIANDDDRLPEISATDGIASCEPRASSLKTQVLALKDRGLSAEASQLVIGSIRHSTRRNYSSKMKLFTTWCDDKKIDCDKHSPVNLCNFLSYLVTEKEFLGRSASVYTNAVACHWKRLHSNIESAASSPLVTALLKGAKSQSAKSPKPKVSWDIGIVLSHIKA
jgi:hypothetical protein